MMAAYRSLMKRIHNTGPKTEPWVFPFVSGNQPLVEQPIPTRCLLPDKYDHIECLEHNHDKSKTCNFGIVDEMDVLKHNLAGAQSYYVQPTS